MVHMDTKMSHAGAEHDRLLQQLKSQHQREIAQLKAEHEQTFRLKSGHYEDLLSKFPTKAGYYLLMCST